MLLAAGRGERMEPLSTWIAKPALDVLGDPLLASSLRALVGAGVERPVVNLHRHPDQVARAARRVLPGRRAVRFSWEPRLLGGAGGLAAARRHFGDGPVLVANADVWAALDLSPLMAVGGDQIVLGLLPHPDPARWNSVVLGEDDRVEAILPAGTPTERPRFHFTGFQAVGAGVIASLPEAPCEMTSVWHSRRAERALVGRVLNGRWAEAGTPEAYRRLVLDHLEDRSWRHPQAAVADSAVLERTAVGAGCRIGDRARLVDSIIVGGAVVGAGCRLERCIGAGPVLVPAGAWHEDALLLSGRLVALGDPNQ
ncbi:MAG: sugar phosphate nucleotidyltransferase [Acidobacteriota bacterium]